MHSLAVIYRDAYFRHLNDRIKEKWAQYSLLGREAKHGCFTAGVGIVAAPLPRPEPPAWELVQGGALPKRQYLIAIAMVDGESASAASEPVAVGAEAGMLVRLRLNANPANGRFLIYAGNGDGSLAKQTEVPLAGVDAWTEPMNGIATAGEPPSDGQRPDVIVRLMNLVDRG